MTKERISMRKVSEVLRLHYEGKLSPRGIAKICGMSRTAVREYLIRFKGSGYGWPLPEGVTDDVLEQGLFPGHQQKRRQQTLLDYNYLVEELRRPNVTVETLWEEYKQAEPEGYQYSYFCELLQGYRKKLNASLRQEHKAGEKGFVDYGTGLFLVDPKTGEKQETKLFVFVWGASNYTYVVATLGEDLPRWIEVNVRALEYFGCCPKVVVPDNLKSAVTKACRYEPELNPTYTEFAEHYGIVVMPTRPHRPKDKAKVETGVKLAKRWILSRLRNHVFTSLVEMNRAILELLGRFNNKPLKQLGKSRKELFETIDRPNALPLPGERYEYAKWKQAKVNINYHVNFDQHDYSVPYTLIHQEVEIRATKGTVEIYHRGKRVCSHCRGERPHGYTTVREHMPPSHQKYLEWTPERIREWGTRYGTAVKTLIEKIMGERKYPEQAYKSCLGIIRLGNRYSGERLNRACERALAYRVYSYRGVKNILALHLEDAREKEEAARNPVNHENIRGGRYYAAQVGEAEREAVRSLSEALGIPVVLKEG
jgi:transposase